MIYDPPNNYENSFNSLAKVGVFTSKLGFQFPRVNAENGLPDAPKPTRIYEQRKRMFKGHYYVVICIIIQFLKSVINLS